MSATSRSSADDALLRAARCQWQARLSSKDLRGRWYGEWGRWRDRLAVRRALARFDVLDADDAVRSAAQESIARACLAAASYDPEQDPANLHRARMTEERARLSQVSAAARTLANSCDRRDMTMVSALGRASSIGVNSMHGTVSLHLDALAMEDAACFFRSLERSFEGPMRELCNGGHWLHQCIGNLRYSKPIQAGARVDTATMLAFELTVYLRDFTAGLLRDPLCQPMPTHGRPCNALVAEFVNASLGTSLTDHHVKFRLQGLPRDVWLASWPSGGESGLCF